MKTKDNEYYRNKKHYIMIVMDDKSRPVCTYDFPSKSKMAEAHPMVMATLQAGGFPIGTAAYCIEFNYNGAKLLASAFIEVKPSEA